MSAKTILTTVTGFLSHHIVDLNNVANVLKELTSAVPLDSQDKERINSAIDTIQSSANNINDYLNNTDIQSVTIRESDIVEALGNFFASDAGKAALASAVGNGSNSNG